MHVQLGRATLVHSTRISAKLSSMSSAPVLSLQAYMHGVRTLVTAIEGQTVQDGEVWACTQRVRELDCKLLLGEHWEEQRVGS